jgi:hypothetical protein
MGLQRIQQLMVLDPQPPGHQERQPIEAELPQLLGQGVQDGAGRGHPGQVGLWSWRASRVTAMANTPSLKVSSRRVDT